MKSALETLRNENLLDTIDPIPGLDYETTMELVGEIPEDVWTLTDEEQMQAFKSGLITYQQFIALTNVLKAAKRVKDEIADVSEGKGSIFAFGQETVELDKLVKYSKWARPICRHLLAEGKLAVDAGGNPVLSNGEYKYRGETFFSWKCGKVYLCRSGKIDKNGKETTVANSEGDALRIAKEALELARS